MIDRFAQLCSRPKDNGIIRWRHAVTCILCISALCSSAFTGQQHLVRAGDDWSDLADVVRPGDQIVLLPGRHTSAQLDDLTGEAKKPITIRALDPKECWIEADGHGLVLNRPRHVILRNLTIVGADIAGLTMTGDGGNVTADDDSAWPGHVRVENVRIVQTGPVGERHAINIHRVRDIQITDARIESWGGSAVNISCSRGVTIEGLTAIGDDEFSQLRLIRVQGESRRVRISRGRFSGAMQQGLVIGANQERHGVCEPSTSTTPTHAATDVHVEHCVFLNTVLPVSVYHASHAAILHCTFVRPRGMVLYSADDAPADDQLATTQHCTFSRNVTIWNAGDLRSAMVFPSRNETPSDRPSGRGGNRRGSRTPAPPVWTIDENLWWSSDTGESLESLGGIPGGSSRPQCTTVDPKLDDAHRTTSPEARGFGASP